MQTIMTKWIKVPNHVICIKNFEFVIFVSNVLKNTYMYINF